MPSWEQAQPGRAGGSRQGTALLLHPSRGTHTECQLGFFGLRKPLCDSARGLHLSSFPGAALGVLIHLPSPGPAFPSSQIPGLPLLPVEFPLAVLLQLPGLLVCSLL